MNDLSSRESPGVRRRYAIVCALFAAMAALLYVGGFGDLLSLQALGRSRMMLMEFAENHPVLAVGGFLAGYVTLVSLSLPGSQIFTMAGGLLFGTISGAVLSVVGASIGALNVFVIASRLIGMGRMMSQDGRVAAIARAIRRDAWSYLLLLRLVPVVPFFAVNLGAAAVGTRTSTYVITTTVGIMPGAIAYSAFGAGLGESISAVGEPSLLDLLSPELIGATLILCTLAIGAIPLRRMLQRT